MGGGISTSRLMDGFTVRAAQHSLMKGEFWKVGRNNQFSIVMSEKLYLIKSVSFDNLIR